MSGTELCIFRGCPARRFVFWRSGLIPIPLLRLGVPSPSDKSKKSIVELWSSAPVQVNYGITETNFLKKFIGGDPDGEIRMGAETQSGHGGPRLSMEARRRLEFAEELSE